MSNSSYNVRVPIAKFAPIKRFEHGEINQDGFGLIKGANQIFSRRSVESSFATDTGVNHGQQSGRNLKTDRCHTTSSEVRATRQSFLPTQMIKIAN
jgi:hypothetical protein